jgi:hypothetical protein
MDKISKLKTLSIFICFVLISLSSCKSDRSNSKINKTIENDVLYENFIEIETSGVNYKIPSPMEMFIFLEKSEAPFLTSTTHNIEKVNTYPSRKSQAINFGIYSADLAYCAVFGDFQQTLNYFNAAKTLANKLGLHEGFGETIALRIDENLNNIDSLLEISADSYFLANQFLENQGQTDLLGYILIGGWIEGLYLAIESVEGVDMKNPIIERIADQQVLLENLLGYLTNNQTSTNITEAISELETLQQVFDELYFNDETTLITEKQFVDISNEVVALRNSFTN